MQEAKSVTEKSCDQALERGLDSDAADAIRRLLPFCGREVRPHRSGGESRACRDVRPSGLHPAGDRRAAAALAAGDLDLQCLGEPPCRPAR